MRISELSRITLPYTSTVGNVIDMLQTSMFGAVIITDGDEPKQIITEGDIRRLLLQEVDKDLRVVELEDRNILLYRPHVDGQPDKFARKHKIRHVVAIDQNGKLLDVYYYPWSVFNPVQATIPVVIMAGGKGTRMRELTENVPKPLLVVSGKPMLEHIIQNYIDHGFTDFYITVNYKKDKIENYIEHNIPKNINVNLISEVDYLGTAGSLSLLPAHVTECIVQNGDVLTQYNVSNFLDFCKRRDANFVTAYKPYQVTIPFGVIKFHKRTDQVDQIDEKPTLDFPVSAGINYIKIHQDIPLKNAYLDMPDLLSLYLEQQCRVFAYNLNEPWLDVGNQDLLRNANSYQYT